MLDQCESQENIISAIEKYIDRHSTQINESGLQDLTELEQCKADKLHRGMKQIISVFNSSIEDGLNTKQVSLNRTLYGENKFARKKCKGIFQIFLEAICDEMLIILMVAAIISIVVEFISEENNSLFWIDGVSIMTAVLVCTLVSTGSNYQKEKQFDELDKMTETTYKYEVIRNSHRQEINRSDIVVGDMLLITTGMEIPADGILYKAVNVIVNESAITGETNEVYKNTLEKCLEQKMDIHAPSPLLISGSTIASGEGIMMVCVVGKKSRAGKNFELIFNNSSEDDEIQTPLQQQLAELATQIGKFGIAASIIIFLLLVVRLLIEELPKGNFILKDQLEKFVQYIIISIAVIVVAIPEGLPLAVTLTLAYSMKSMYHDKILVRKLQSCETMGAAEYLCSDKTGTITQNKMKVKSIINMKELNAEEFNYFPLSVNYMEKLESAIFYNTSAVVEIEKGSQTEIALLKFIRKLSGKDEEKVRKELPDNACFQRIPFDSNRKRMTTGITLNGENCLFMNGASEQILDACNRIQNFYSGEIINLTPKLIGELNSSLEKMARKGYRTLALSYKPLSTKEIPMIEKEHINEVQEIEKNEFILLGIFGIEDPPRKESKEAISKCAKAGINVIMVTGDNKITAANIAEQVGIINEEKTGILEANDFVRLLEKAELFVLPDKNEKKNLNWSLCLNNDEKKQKFSEIISGLAVMARSKPEHKYILVDGISQMGHIVGVTGDGANDAPALIKADIGLAMGITGTQVAKNASDIIILDDNFNSIVKAIVAGRNVYASVRKFLQFQLTVNIIAVFMVLISAAIIRQSVLTSVQMLWVNMIMDSLAALALATEPPDADKLLNQKPNSPMEKLLTKTMMKHIVGQVIFQLIVLNIILFLGPTFIPEFKDEFDQVIGSDLEAKYFNGILESTVTDGRFYYISGEDLYQKWFDKYSNYSRHLTFFFNVFVFLQVFNFICCRRIKDEINVLDKICSNTLFWGILSIIVVLQILIISFGGRFFQFYSYGGLNFTQWIISVGIGALTIPVSLVLRILPFLKPSEEETIEKENSFKMIKTLEFENTVRKFDDLKL